MPIVSVQEIVQILQISIAPVVLISGVGLLVLSLTNRLGRVIDRVRLLIREKKTADEKEIASIEYQISILYRRATIIRFSIAMAGLSILFDALLVIILFILSLLKLGLAGIVALIFGLSLIFLILSIVAFLQDVNLNLRALRSEIGLI